MKITPNMLFEFLNLFISLVLDFFITGNSVCTPNDATSNQMNYYYYCI